MSFAHQVDSHSVVSMTCLKNSLHEAKQKSIYDPSQINKYKKICKVIKKEQNFYI